MRRRAWLLLLPGVFFGLFFVLPVGTLLVTSFGRATGETAAALVRPAILQVFAFTVFQAAVSTAVTLTVGIAGAAVLARFTFRGRSLIEALSVVAFVMPTVVVAAAVEQVLPAGWDRGLVAIVVAHVYFNLAVVLRLVGTYWAHLDPRPAEAAACLGASPARVWWTVTLVRLRPAVMSAAAVVFLFTVTSFGIVLLLGGPGQATVEVEIQRQALFLFDLPLAAALSVVQILVVALLVVLQVRLSARVGESAGAARLRRPRAGRQRLMVVAFAVVALAVLAGPMVSVLIRSLRVGPGWGLDHYTGLGAARADSVLFVPPAQAVLNSLSYAVAAAAIAVVVGGCVSWWVVGDGRGRGGIDTWVLLPLGVSAVTLGLGILITFDTPPINWRAGAWLVPVAQALVAIPFVVRALVPALRAVGPRVREAAATLGAGPWQVVRSVELPLVARALAVAMGFSFAISLGEFGATLFVARGDRPTVPIAIYRLLGTPGEANVGQAMALCVVLIVLVALAVLLTDRWRIGSRAHV